MPDLQPSDPRVIGSYRVVARIGEGGMGVVFLALDPAGRPVAVKVVRRDLAGDPTFRARFAREVEAARRVGGVSTVRFLDGDLQASEPYLVTEYVPGGNLADAVARYGPLPWEYLTGLAIGLAQALVAMNAAGVIHRDLKPTNVLLADSGPKVADFGISQALDGAAATQTGLLMGSPAWMAPEQAVGGPATPATDVFAWGAVVAFAATGRPPFGDGRADAVLYRVVHQEPDLVGLDPRLAPLVVRALAKDPAARPSPDGLLIEAIRTATNGVAGVAAAGSTPPVVADPGPGRRRRGRTAIWVAAAVVAVLAGVTAGAVVAHRQATPQSAPPTTTAKGGPGSTTPTTAAAGGPGSSTTAPPPPTVTADLPLTVCQTTFGIPEGSVPVLPSTVSESVPSDLASQLAVYTDQLGTMEVLAPAGWSCSAELAADGGSDVSVYPPGQPDPEGASGTATEAVVGSQTGGCVGCAVTQASGLFPDAATACAQQFEGAPGTCPAAPAGETDVPLGDGIVGFLDPPGVTGSGLPSGGADPANGVVTYHGGGDSPSYEDTCTLPDAMHPLCTAVLDAFVTAYGSQ